MTRKKIIIFLLAILALIIFYPSSNEDDPRYQPLYYCDKEYRDSSVSLSEQLEPVKDLMTQKTGVYVLEEGDAAMISRAWLSEYAEKTIDVQYFIFSADNVGLIAADFLLRAADRGVKVRILVDDIMVEAESDELLALDAHPNLSIKIYNPVANIGKNIVSKLYAIATDFKGFNQRMHNKTFIVDEKIVITGGRNIADEYFDYDHEYNFRDRDVLLLGKITKQVENSFELFWNSPLSVPIDKIVEVDKNEINAEAKYAYLHQYACNPQNFWPQVRERVREIPQAFKKIQESGELLWLDEVYFVSDFPGKNNKEGELSGGGRSSDYLAELIQRAKKSIYIESPYLITTDETRALFSAAVKRGVQIKILTNSLASTDNIEAFSGYQRDREELLATGVRIYEFKPDAAVRKKVMTGSLYRDSIQYPIFGLHAKTMLIDDSISVIGTFNFDPRSVNLNTECVTVIGSRIVAARLKENLLEDFKAENSWETTQQMNPDSVSDLFKRIKLKTRRVVPKSIL
ncbi:MAG: phospholipase D family protein [Bacteroidetes bacterium]|nr:phospholipase D family protein [Bacteroidota bacterium]